MCPETVCGTRGRFLCPRGVPETETRKASRVTPKQRVGAMHGTEPKGGGSWSRVAERRAAVGPYLIVRRAWLGAKNAWV